MNNKNFFIDLLGRLLSSNPTFFKYVQWISIAVAAITGLPDLLNTFGITLTGKWLMFENKTIAIAAVVATIIAQLPNKDVTQVK